MWAAVSAARAMAAHDRSSVCAYPVRSPETTLTPSPQLTPALPVRMMPSSSSREDVRWYSK
jgi:hypothetical protein